MKTRLLAMIILFNMLSPLSYAGTEETKKCLERIDYLKNEIDRIHGAIETDNKTKETIDKKRSDLRDKTSCACLYYEQENRTDERGNQ